MNSEIKETKRQILTLRNQAELELTGVTRLQSMNNSEFVVETSFGDILIRGINLEMKQLDTEKGIIWINGKVVGIEYLDSPKQKQKSFFGKLFKWFTQSKKK